MRVVMLHLLRLSFPVNKNGSNQNIFWVDRKHYFPYKLMSEARSCLESEVESCCGRARPGWLTSPCCSWPGGRPGASTATATCCYGLRARTAGSVLGKLRLLHGTLCQFEKIIVEMHNLEKFNHWSYCGILTSPAFPPCYIKTSQLSSSALALNYIEYMTLSFLTSRCC